MDLAEEMDGEAGRDLILIDGQLNNNKKPKQATTELELMLMKTPGALMMCNSNGGSGAANVQMGNNLNTTVFTNQANAIRHDSVDSNAKQSTIASSEQLDRRKSSVENDEDFPLQEEEEGNVLSISVPSGFGQPQPNGTMETANMAITDSNDKIDTATADVIISEYPVDCFPEQMYDYCPWCLAETPFWIRWKEIRLRCYQFVEHKYFETLVITLILLSSMALVSGTLNSDSKILIFVGSGGCKL